MSASSGTAPAAFPGHPPQNSHAAKSFYLETYGCQMNIYDTKVILDLLLRSGFVRTDDPITANLVLVNTCSVREHAEHRAIARLHELRRLRERAGLPRSLLVICGCMAERLQDKLARHDVRPDLVVGVDRYEAIPALVEELLQRSPVRREPLVIAGHDDEVHYVAPPDPRPTNNSHLVTIHKGCDYRCTYCIVPTTRGPQREKPPRIILDEIRAIADAGGQEVTLLGQNVTAYRWRDGLDFTGLLALILDATDVARLRFLTGHPRDMHPRLMDLMGRHRRICPWLHVPAQSGSDRILQRMGRRYRRDEYLQMVAYARSNIAGVTFSSDFIVGFPGESEDDFVETLDLIEAVGFDSIFAFKYSPRDGTPAAALADDVPLQQKKRRLSEVLALQASIWEGIASRQVGKVWQAVVEAPARRPEGHWRLRTSANRKVVARLPDGAVGQIHSILITGWKHTTFLGVAPPSDH